MSESEILCALLAGVLLLLTLIFLVAFLLENKINRVSQSESSLGKKVTDLQNRLAQVEKMQNENKLMRAEVARKLADHE